MKRLDIFKREDFSSKVTYLHANVLFNKWLVENNIDISHLVPCEHKPVYVEKTKWQKSWWSCVDCGRDLKVDKWSVIE